MYQTVKIIGFMFKNEYWNSINIIIISQPINMIRKCTLNVLTYLIFDTYINIIKSNINVKDKIY